MSTKSLTLMRKSELFQLAKKFDQNISYRRSTKAMFINIITNRRPMSNQSMVFDDIVKPCNECNYTEDYVQNLLDQVELWKKIAKEKEIEANKWRDKYIENILKNNEKVVEKPMIQPMIQPMTTIDKPMTTIDKPVEVVKKLEEKPKIVEVQKVPKPFDLLEKIDKNNSDLRLPDIIKQNSLIDHVNTMTMKEIEEFGFKSRKDYFDNKKQKITINNMFSNQVDGARKKLKNVKKCDKKKKKKPMNFLDELKMKRK